MIDFFVDRIDDWFWISGDGIDNFGILKVYFKGVNSMDFNILN